jgi:excisionase family DNA binding protein
VPTKSKPAPREARRLVESGFAKPREAAKFLRIGNKWMYDLLRVGAISHLRHGRSIVIPWASIHEYAAQRLKLGRIA